MVERAESLTGRIRDEPKSHTITLPVELYRPIVQNLTSSTDLYPLLFVSRALHVEAERAIYDTVVLRFLPETDSEDSVVERLADCPRVAKLVHTFNIHSTIGGTQSRDYTSFWRAVQRALQSMTDLLYLNIEDSLSIPPYGPNDCLLWNCSFRLRTLGFGTIESPHFDILQSFITQELQEFICWSRVGNCFPHSKQYPLDVSWW